MPYCYALIIVIINLALCKKFSLWLGIKIVLVCWFNLTIFVPSHKEKGQQSKKENQKQYVNQKSKEEN